MVAAASDARFRTAVSLPPIRSDLIDEIARVAIALYWQQANFTVLHMVTATHAARIVFDHFPDLATESATQALWGAVCAAYASVGAPLLTEDPAQADPPSWDEIYAKAVAINDDHIIKMTFTCHCQAKRHSNPLYQAAAARLVAVGRSN